jgi:hypothetical protein
MENLKFFLLLNDILKLDLTIRESKIKKTQKISTPCKTYLKALKIHKKGNDDVLEFCVCT